jgi:2-keto-4-pentenoate hydratase/2-oxohepta-3-ene-1,7-dioic acid hydratase in catechol pathway
MIFSVAEVVSYASRYMTLDPGDLIITGTPEGVILGMPEPRAWLKAGDEVAVEVEGLGKLVTPLVGPA